MKCVKCGAEFQDDPIACRVCGTINSNREEKGIVEFEEGIYSSDPIVQYNYEYNDFKMGFPISTTVGKKYCFYSARGANALNVINSRIKTDIEVGTDRIYISIKPKRLNKVPAVFFQDITGIIILNRLNGFCWFWLILTTLMGFTAYVFLICPILIFLFCRHNKITIYQRNGIKAVIYVKKRVEAEKFVEDLKSLLKIK